MGEIDRVNNVIDSHFEVYGDPRKHPKEMAELTERIERCVFMAETRFAGEKMEDEAVKEMILDAKSACVVLSAATGDGTMASTITEIFNAHGMSTDELDEFLSKVFGAADIKSGEILTAENFKKAAELAMIARRATYPLEPKEYFAPPPTPREALYDDDDVHSWAIFDSMIQPIQDLLPPLYQLACEDFQDGASTTEE